MNPTQLLHAEGQSLWLDYIDRDLLAGGALLRYIREWSVTGLTSNPTLFDQAIHKGTAYDESIRRRAAAVLSGEELVFEVALEDITRAADLFIPTHGRTDGVDGWVSLEVSPLLAHDAVGTRKSAQNLYARAARPNLFIKIPGTAEGLAAIEESIFAGIPVNVTLLFSAEQYLAAANAYLRGIERRIRAALDPNVASVASLFVSRWDVAVAGKNPAELDHRLGLAVARRAYQLYMELLVSKRWLRACNAGARPQRLLFASTGTKDPKASDTLYVNGLVAPLTINTTPLATLAAFADHGEVAGSLAPDGGDCERVLGEFQRAGINLTALAARLQEEGAAAFVRSWEHLLEAVSVKRAALAKAC
jgi:transaldolase